MLIVVCPKGKGLKNNFNTYKNVKMLLLCVFHYMNNVIVLSVEIQNTYIYSQTFAEIKKNSRRTLFSIMEFKLDTLY